MTIERVMRIVAIAGAVGAAVIVPVSGFHLGPHEAIVRSALPAGKKMDADALRRVIDANLSMDLHQADSERHFDNARDPADICDLWKRGLNNYLDRALTFAEPIGTEKRELADRDKALDEFGYATHAIGDFYSHTNWIELHPPSAGGVLFGTPPQAPILAQSCDAAAFPADLHSGYFDVGSTSASNGLGCNAAARSKGWECHSALNKDSKDEPRGSMPFGGGRNYHEAAVAVAEAATAAAWRALGDRIEARYGTVATDGKCVFAKLAWGGDRSCHRKWGATAEIKTFQEYAIPDGTLFHDLTLDHLSLSFDIGSEEYPGPGEPPVYADVRGSTHQNGTFCQWVVTSKITTPRTCQPYRSDTDGSDDARVKVTPYSEPIELDWRVTFPGKKPDCGNPNIFRLDPGRPAQQPFLDCPGPEPIPFPARIRYTGTFSMHPE
jgi:hypothetical protein